MQDTLLAMVVIVVVDSSLDKAPSHIHIYEKMKQIRTKKPKSIKAILLGLINYLYCIFLLLSTVTLRKGFLALGGPRTSDMMMPLTKPL